MALTEAEELELLELEEAEAKAAAPAPMSPLKSGALGAAEGFTFGFADEMAGAGSAYTGVPGNTASEKAVHLITDPEARRKVMSDYLAARDMTRGGLHQARKDNPKAFFAGEVAGTVPSMFIPGAGQANAGRVTAQMAALGALQGLGSSEADLTKGDVGGAARDTGIGAGIGLLTHGATEGVIKPIARGARDLVAPAGAFVRRRGGQVLEKLAGLNPKLARLLRREGSQVFEDTAGTPESVNAAVGGIQDVIEKARREAGESLGAVKEGLGLNETLEQKAQRIAREGTRELTTPEVVRQTLGALDPAAPKGPESMANLVKLRQSIDDLLTFSKKGLKPVASEEEAVLSQLRSRINERLEGITAPTLEKSAMGAASSVPGPRDPVGKRLRDAERAFAETADTTERLTPKFETTPKAVSTVKAQLDEGLRSVDPDVRDLGNLPGGADALKKAKNEVARFLLEGADPEPGGGTASLLAQTLGLTPQRAGRLIALLEGPRAAELTAKFPGLTKAAQALQRAAARGPQAVATTNYLLQQQDSEYRALMQELQNDRSGE